MIPIHEWIGTLRHRGLQLWLDGEDLSYRAPKGVIGTSDLAELRARKSELIAFLRSVSGSTSSATRISAVPRTGNPSQSFAQQRLWFLYHLNGPSAVYNIVSQHHLSGPLDCSVLERSFRELCRRHEILRTTFATENEIPVQVISPEVRLPFIVTPVSGSMEALRLAEEEAIHIFDLSTGPLFRVRLLRCDAENHILLLTAHHIICDGWSLGILFSELATLYRALRRGQASPLPAPDLHYADYAQWQREWLTSPVLETQLNYWRRLQGAPPLLDLFADNPRSGELSSRGAVEPIRIEPDQARRFKLLCQASGVTVFMGMLAVLQALLARHTGQRDIVLGTQVAGRTRNEMEQVPGFFVNTLPLRVDVDATQPFITLLGQVKQTTLEAMTHQETPFEKIVEMLQPERMSGRNPLVQVMFLWQNARMDMLSLDDVHVGPFSGVVRSTAKFDLTLEMGEVGNGFEGVLEYRTDLYDSRMIREFGSHLQTFLSSVVEYPDRPLMSLPMLQEQEQERLLAQGLGKVVPAGASTIAARFEHQARNHPDRLAVVFRGVQVTYAELDSRASRLADYLRGFGIGPEIPVGLFLDPSIELIVAMLGVLKAGGVYLPLDTRSPKSRLAMMLEDSATPVVLTMESLHSLLPPSSAQVFFLDRELPQCVDTLAHVSDPENIAYIIYTSGSTGTPKGVMVSHRAVLNLTEWMAREIFQQKEAIRTALIASPAFDASVQQIFGCLLNGHTLYPVDPETRRDGARLRRFFEDHAIELSDCTPSLLAILCDAGIPGDLNLALRCLLVGGEALPASLVDELYRQDSTRRISLINVYGPTECCVDSTSFLAEKKTGTSVVSIGGGIFNSEIYILDPYGHPAPEAVAGEICIAGAGLGRGYWRRPGLTASAFVPHPFRKGERLYRTGDRGYWNADGHIEFIGRNDDQVKIRGHRIQLGDVETHLAMHPHIRQAVVVTREASATHKELVAYLAGDPSLSVGELRRFAAGSLPEYMIPAHFVLMDALSLNASGKVDRKLLPPPDETRTFRQESEFIAPRNSNETALTAVWAAVLGRERIGVRDHYISLGGDSIKALQISARLREAGFKLELSDLFLHPTIEALAPHLQMLSGREEHEEAVGEVPLTPVQLRFLQEFEGRLHHFNQSTLLSPSEQLEEGPLRQALDSIVQHHDMLRATFSRQQDGWEQRIDPSPSVAAFDVVDLGDSSEAVLTQHASAVQSGFSLDKGPLFRAVLYRTVRGDRLFLCAHHLVIDAVSWRILIEDLEAAYRSAKAGSVIRLPARTTPFRSWTRRLAVLANSGELAAEFWPPAETAPALPPDHAGPACLVRDCATHSFDLSRGLTAGVLRECHDAYGTEVNDILLAALARTLRRFSGRADSRIWLEGHGRESLFAGVDVSRTVGWFTAIYPVVLDLGPTNEIDRNIKLVKETLRAIPRKGIGYGLLRYLAPPDVRRRFSEEPPGIVFNYLGQFGTLSGMPLFARSSEDCGPMADVEARFSQDIEINALANNDCLEFHVSYNPWRFRHETIVSLSRQYVEELETLVEHTRSRTRRELTPSDVDYAGFSLDEMENFLNNLPEKS